MNPAQPVERFFAEAWSQRRLTILRVEEGRIVEDWVIVESLGVFQQPGLVRPTPELIADAARGAA
jgi:hypothetical protein